MPRGSLKFRQKISQISRKPSKVRNDFCFKLTQQPTLILILLQKFTFRMQQKLFYTDFVSQSEFFRARAEGQFAGF